MGKLYLSGKLQIPGHVPVPSPGPKTVKSRRLLSSLLPAPLRNLTMDAEGHLIIPDDSELSRFCPVAKRLAEWRIQYPRPKIDATSPAPAPAPAPPAGGGAEPPGPGDSLPAGTPPPGVEASLPAGTMKPNLEAVSAIGDTIIKDISWSAGNSSIIERHSFVFSKDQPGWKAHLNL